MQFVLEIYLNKYRKSTPGHKMINDDKEIDKLYISRAPQKMHITPVIFIGNQIKSGFHRSYYPALVVPTKHAKRGAIRVHKMGQGVATPARSQEPIIRARVY